MFKPLILLVLLYSTSAFSQNLKAFISLSPAGDFIAQSSEVKGQATENADGSVEAKDIKVAVKSLNTGITLRNDHMNNKYLEAEKYPDITLKIAKGKNGKGEAIIILKGKQAKVSGNYIKGKDKLKASFTIKLSDFGIDDINYKGVGAEDEVKVEVTVPLVKVAATSKVQKK